MDATTVHVRSPARLFVESPAPRWLWSGFCDALCCRCCLLMLTCVRCSRPLQCSAAIRTCKLCQRDIARQEGVRLHLAGVDLQQNIAGSQTQQEMKDIKRVYHHHYSDMKWGSRTVFGLVIRSFNRACANIDTLRIWRRPASSGSPISICTSSCPGAAAPPTALMREQWQHGPPRRTLRIWRRPASSGSLVSPCVSHSEIRYGKQDGL